MNGRNDGDGNRSIRFDWYWKPHDGILAERALLAIRAKPRWLRLTGWAVAAAAVIALVLIAGAPPAERGALASRLLPALILCAWILIEVHGMFTHRAHAFHEAMDATHPITVTISDEGYSTGSYRGSKGSPWTHFQGAHETDDFLLLLRAGSDASYFPKRAVPADDLEAIRGILRRHFGEQARLMDAPASDRHLHHAAGRPTQAIGGLPEIRG